MASILINESPTSDFQFHCGLKQRDPLAPYLFILILESLHLPFSRAVDAGIFTGIKIDSSLTISHLFYADDAVFIGEWSNANLTGSIPCRYSKAVIGVKVLGRTVSKDADFISGLAMRRVTNAVDLMGLLSLVHMEEADLFFDKGLRGSIENMVLCGEPFFEDLQWRLASLPILFAGLGLYSTKVASSYASVASRGQSWVLIDHILLESGICGMDDDYVSALDCLRSMIPSFDFSRFTNKTTVTSKAQQTLACALFSEMVKNIDDVPSSLARRPPFRA
nr:hypothetical protein [Tanacetum cinerariifolium]